MAFFKLESTPPIRDLAGRFRSAAAGVPEELRDEMREEARRFIDLADEESPGSKGTMRRGYTFKTFNTTNGLELNVYPGLLGKWHMEGTGIYGPRGQVIRPIHARVLHWTSGGEEFFRPWVRGIRPNPIFSRAYRRWLPGARKVLRKVALSFIRTLKTGAVTTKEVRP